MSPPPRAITKLHALFPKLKMVFQYYGSTEVGGHVTCNM